MEGGASVPDVGNLEGEEQSCVKDNCFSYNRLKSYFVRFLYSRVSVIHDVDYSFVRCIMCLL